MSALDRAAAFAAQRGPIPAFTRPQTISLAREIVSQANLWACETDPGIPAGKGGWRPREFQTGERGRTWTAYGSTALVGSVVGARRRFQGCSEVQVRLWAAGRTHLIGVKGIRSQTLWGALQRWEKTLAALHVPLALAELALLAVPAGVDVAPVRGFVASAAQRPPHSEVTRELAELALSQENLWPALIEAAGAAVAWAADPAWAPDLEDRS